MIQYAHHGVQVGVVWMDGHGGVEHASDLVVQRTDAVQGGRGRRMKRRAQSAQLIVGIVLQPCAIHAYIKHRAQQHSSEGEERS